MFAPATRSLPASLAGCCVLFAAAPLLGQKVWVVAPLPGAGVDFTVIQDAVGAAADGDVVLVRGGTYAGFTIDGKALTVAADAPVGLTNGSSVSISRTTAAQAVVVRGFSLSSSSNGALSIASATDR